MGFFDFIVVYLAFGAPFAVYEYLQKSDLLRSIGVFLLWPAAAYRVFHQRLYPPVTKIGTESELESRSKKIFARIKREIGGKIDAIEVRDTYDRYVGLSIEIGKDQKPAETKSAELLRISGRQDNPAAAACLTRRNSERLAHHHIDARERFLELIERPQEFNLLVLGLEIATLVADADAQEYLNRKIGHDRTMGEVWETQKQHEAKKRIAA